MMADSNDATSQRPPDASPRGSGWGVWVAILVWAVLILGPIAAAPLLNLVRIGGMPLGYGLAAGASFVLLLSVLVLFARTQDRRARRRQTPLRPAGTAR